MLDENILQGFKGLPMIKKITLDTNRISVVEPFAFKVGALCSWRNLKVFFLSFMLFMFLNYLNERLLVFNLMDVFFSSPFLM